jgi:hypothetical protein
MFLKEQLIIKVKKSNLMTPLYKKYKNFKISHAFLIKTNNKKSILIYSSIIN